mmetsp:Transcript_12382/g.19728  ORF Transcript_12382/g.19728 Transcript_12382/m.19728 type:complete len:394 (-) Transcript_12382:89-1270(-)
MSLDANEKGSKTRCDNHSSHEVEGLQCVQLAESKSKADSTHVTTSTNNTSNRSSNGRVDIGDNSVGGALGSLDNSGEKDHDDNGSRKRVRVGKDEYQATLNSKKHCLPDETTAHAHPGIGLIRNKATNTTSEKVHPAEDGGNGSRSLGGKLELGPEIGCSGVVHGELNPKAARVLEEEDPGVDVHGTATEGGSSGDLWHGTILLHFLVVSLGSIIRNSHDEKSKAESHGSRNNAHGPPGLLSRHAELEKGEENRPHNKLGDTSSKVTPAAHKCVGSTGDFLGKHTRSPKLAAHEGRSTKSNEETKNGEGSSTIDKTSASARNRAKHKEHSHKETGAVLVTHRTIDEAHEDSASYRANVGRPNILLRDAQGILNLRKERSDSEPDEEGCEESHP